MVGLQLMAGLNAASNDIQTEKCRKRSATPSIK